MEFAVSKTSHQFEDNYVMPIVEARFKEKLNGGYWTINIDSLEELVQLSEKYGSLIFNAEFGYIEIYDGYRE